MAAESSIAASVPQPLFNRRRTLNVRKHKQPFQNRGISVCADSKRLLTQGLCRVYGAARAYPKRKDGRVFLVAAFGMARRDFFMRSLFRLGTIRIEILCRAAHIGGASQASHSRSRLCGFCIGDRTLA
jgi:hypothetical protein